MTKAEKKWWHNWRSFWGKFGHRVAQDTGLLDVGCLVIEPDHDGWSDWLHMWGQIATVVASHARRDAAIAAGIDWR